MFSAIRTIYHGDSHAKPIFDPPYTPEEAQLLDHLHRAMGETAEIGRASCRERV